jgi:hypothetical protein
MPYHLTSKLPILCWKLLFILVQCVYFRMLRICIKIFFQVSLLKQDTKSTENIKTKADEIDLRHKSNLGASTWQLSTRFVPLCHAFQLFPIKRTDYSTNKLLERRGNQFGNNMTDDILLAWARKRKMFPRDPRRSGVFSYSSYSRILRGVFALYTSVLGLHAAV